MKYLKSFKIINEDRFNIYRSEIDQIFLPLKDVGYSYHILMIFLTFSV